MIDSLKLSANLIPYPNGGLIEGNGIISVGGFFYGDSMKLFEEIEAERVYQDKKWGGPRFDDANTREDWIRYIIEYATGVRGTDIRSRMIKCAALAIAAIESERRALMIPTDRSVLLRHAMGLSVIFSSNEGEQIERVVTLAKSFSLEVIIAQCLSFVNALDEQKD